MEIEELAVRYPYTIYDIRALKKQVEKLTGRERLEDVEKVIVFAQEHKLGLIDSAFMLWSDIK